MNGLMKWSLVAVVFVGLAVATAATAEAGRRYRVRYVRPVHARYYAAPVVVHAHPVRVHVPVRRVHIPHPPIPPHPVRVVHPPAPPFVVPPPPPAVQVYHGPRVVTPWVTVW
jgi:hypothetical protein